MPLLQSDPWDDSLKHVALLVFPSFFTVQSSCSAMMVQSLEKLVLLTVLLVLLLDLLKAVWHLPLKKICLSTLLKLSRTTELTNLSRTLHWDDPVARVLDSEVYRRKMAGKSCRFCSESIHSFPYTLFLGFSGFSRSRVSSACPLAHSLFFLVSLTTLEDKPVCHIYQWIASTPSLWVRV